MLERLISIIYILMNKGTITAGELAERFEVSTRTIYRDVEALSMAGIPVYCKKGKNGGISLTEEFVLNKMLITKEEQQEILAALVGLKETEVSGSTREEETLKKLGEFFRAEPIPWVNIDLSDWSGLRRQMYEDIKRAILTRHVIEFDYYGQNRPMSHRVVESEFPVTPLTLWIDKKEAYRVYDRFDESELEQLPDGNFLARCAYPLDEWVYSLILWFGPSAKVLEPEFIRTEVQNRIRKMMENYK